MRTLTILLAAAPLAAGLAACERKEAPAPAQPAQTQAAPQNRPAPGVMPSAAPAAPSVDEQTGRVALDGVSFVPPEAWEFHPPSNSMRAAEYVVPGEQGAATLVVYYFGPTGAGGVDANIERWCGQFAQPDGSNSIGRAEIDEAEVNGMTVRTIWLTGTFVAAMTPGAPVSDNEPGWALHGAIVETPTGPYYFKAVGPEATLDANREAFDEMVASFQAP